VDPSIRQRAHTISNKKTQVGKRRRRRRIKSEKHRLPLMCFTATQQHNLLNDGDETTNQSQSQIYMLYDIIIPTQFNFFTFSSTSFISTLIIITFNQYHFTKKKKLPNQT